MKAKPCIQYDLEGRMFLMSSLNGEKTRQDRRQDVIKNIPVLMNLDRSTVQTIIDKANVKYRPKNLLRLLKQLGYNDDLRSIRYFVANTLYFRLMQDDGLQNISPRGWPAMLNTSLGHILRSNQWCPYLLKNPCNSF